MFYRYPITKPHIRLLWHRTTRADARNPRRASCSSWFFIYLVRPLATPSNSGHDAKWDELWSLRLFLLCVLEQLPARTRHKAPQTNVNMSSLISNGNNQLNYYQTYYFDAIAAKPFLARLQTKATWTADIFNVTRWIKNQSKASQRAMPWKLRTFYTA